MMIEQDCGIFNRFFYYSNLDILRNAIIFIDITMSFIKEPTVTEEPLPGWLRFETEGDKPWFKTPVPRTVIRDASKLQSFLGREHQHGRMLDVDGSEFSFKRRLGLQKKPVSSSSTTTVSSVSTTTVSSSSTTSVSYSTTASVSYCPTAAVSLCPTTTVSFCPVTFSPTAAFSPSVSCSTAVSSLTSVFEISRPAPETVKGGYQCQSTVERLTRSSTETLDHRKILSKSSQNVDTFRLNDGYQTPDNFEELKRKVSSSPDLRDLLATLNRETAVVDAFNLMFSDECLQEISQIDSKTGPLVDFPASINQNVYSQIVEYGMAKCPSLVMFVINMVVRRGEPVLPSDVLKISTLFSSICYVANKELDALVKLRSLNLQVDGLSNIGLNVLSDMGLAQCARSLSNHRDFFADIGPQVMNSTAASFPYQSTLDNCDFQQEHLTVESVEKEIFDTSDLCTTKKSKDEALALFDKNQVLLGLDENKDEKDHLMYVIAVAAAKILVEARPEVAKQLSKFIPAHHDHQNAEKKLVPALTFILKPYALQETRNPDTIKLLIKIQRQFLRSVAKSRDDDPSFLKMLLLLEDANAPQEEREVAEKSVREAGHGDLLTVKMVQEAKMLMVGSATAFGRLEFLGPFRIQMLHMKMKKITQDISSCMKREINFDDPLTLTWLAALNRMKISNKGKDIKKNDSSFEKHDQYVAAVQASYWVNMFDNYHDENSERLNSVNSLDDLVTFVMDMLDYFNIELYFDPDRQEPAKNDEEDDLFEYCQVCKMTSFQP